MNLGGGGGRGGQYEDFGGGGGGGGRRAHGLTQGHDSHFIPVSGSWGTNAWSRLLVTIAQLGTANKMKKRRRAMRSIWGFMEKWSYEAWKRRGEERGRVIKEVKASYVGAWGGAWTVHKDTGRGRVIRWLGKFSYFEKRKAECVCNVLKANCMWMS